MLSHRKWKLQPSQVPSEHGLTEQKGDVSARFLDCWEDLTGVLSFHKLPDPSSPCQTVSSIVTLPTSS